MHWLQQLKGSFYTLFFIVLNVVYLIIELSFNSRILDVSAAFSPATDFGQLELYGRSISASGATLFAWRLFVSPHSKASFFRIWLRFFVIALVVFPTVFIGQKKLVDSLVNLSSAQTRRSAEILSLLKFGVANGFVEIDELALNDIVLQSAEGKMFITVAGLLAYNSTNMRAVLERELAKITAYAIQTEQAASSRRLYRAYRFASEKVRQDYKIYQQLVMQLEQQQAQSNSKAIALYQQAMNQALQHWRDYQHLLAQDSPVQAASPKQVSALQYRLFLAQQRIDRCHDESCFEQGVQMLEQGLTRQLGFYSPLAAWCKTRSGNGRKTLQCLKNTQSIANNINHYQALSLAMRAGLTKVYANRLAYLTSVDFRASVFAWLARQDIQTRASWDFSHYKKLIGDIQKQLDARYLAQYDTAVQRRFAGSIKPRTDVLSFAMTAKMQNYFAQAFGDFYYRPVALNLTFEAFDRGYVAPIFSARYGRLLNKLQADKNWYRDGAPYERSGKASLRNLVVPAVAIAFSLIFGLLNAINLLLNVLFFLVQEKFWLRWGGFCLMLALVLLMPVRHRYRIYNQPPYQDLVAETRKNYGAWADFLDWVAKTEPLVYPLGNILRYNVLNGFSFD